MFPAANRASPSKSLAPRIYEGGRATQWQGEFPAAAGKALSVALRTPALPEGEPRVLRAVPAPRIYEGGGPRSGRGSPPPQRESLLSHGFAVPAPPEGKPRALRTVLAPRIYEGGGPRSGRGSPPPQRGRPSQSRCARRLSQRESQGGFAPFLPPAFMRGEGHAVAGGVLRRSGGESLLSHGFAVSAPPEGKPRGLRPFPAPRIYEGGGPRSGRGSFPPQRESPLSRAARASSPGGRAKGAAPRSPVILSR